MPRKQGIWEVFFVVGDNLMRNRHVLVTIFKFTKPFAIFNLFNWSYSF